MSDELPIGQQLRAARERAQVGKSELSERGKIDRQRIHNVESGSELPSEKTIMAYVNVCGLFGVAGDTLFLNANKTPPDIFAMMRDDPEICEELRKRMRIELLAQGG